MGLTDWDIDGTHWKDYSLTHFRYHSEDCCFHWHKNERQEILVKTSEVPIADVKEGRLVFWFFHESDAEVDSFLLAFRHQDANDHYVAHLCPRTNLIWIRQVSGGVTTTLASGTWIYGTDEWHKVRITWFEDPDWGGLVIMFERWDGAEWVKIIYAHDVDNKWSATGGRVGFRAQDHTVWIDDVEILGG